MSGLGRLSANILSAANENVLALANLKFDFSLMKVEAPKEYSGFGEALSTRRRNDAEDGFHHQTARRLSALFEQLVPSTPSLIKAYGLRSSEIVQTSNVNPKGSSKDGPFETFVGADGTAMWAAATSGIPALGIYFLACLLARAWGAKEAVSIWVEIVEQRRKDITHGFENQDLVPESSRLSAIHAISRNDLARWDASARAWLQSADHATLKQQTQLMLIVKNIQLPFFGGSSTYSQIIESWQHAMICLERLIKGEPQEISNRAILLAYSAWHLYPDLIILGNPISKVIFNDRCVNSNGVGTLSRQPRSNTTKQGTTWSLALSHLRYYGDPVIARSDLDFSRVTIQQLHVIALGSIYNHWRISRQDTASVSQWFMCLWDCLRRNLSSSNESRTLRGLGWFQYLAEAARKTDSSDHSVKEDALQLLAYGSRRAKRFLGTTQGQLVPFFGLGNSCILAGLSAIDETERGLTYLRKLAERNGLCSSDAFIGTSSKNLLPGKVAYIQEFFTAVPHTRASKKRNSEGKQLNQMTHGRWVCLHRDARSTTAEEDASLELQVQDRLRQTHTRGEHGTRILESPAEVAKGDWSWPTPPLLFDFEKHAQFVSSDKAATEKYCCPSLNEPGMPCWCFDCDTPAPSPRTRRTVFWSLSHIGKFQLYIRNTAQYRRDNGIPDLDPSASSEICTSSIIPDVLTEYLQYAIDPCMEKPDNHEQHWGNFEQRNEYIEEIAKADPSCKERLSNLKALALATETYLNLEGAMVSLKVVDSPLDKSLWLEKHTCLDGHNRVYQGPCKFALSLPRLNTLSCIVHFESGTLHLEPEVFEETLAIASGNSLFVIAPLLSDPVDTAAKHCVRRITGNIGRPGISFLIAPIDPKIRPLGDQYNLVSHALYDGKRENNFMSTSLHISFTDWTLPVEAKGTRTGLIDQDAYFVESIVSVLDSGKWVADLDILCIDFDVLTRLEPTPRCSGHQTGDSEYDYTSIDNWEELLDGPREVGFFRAHGNWAARLAAVSILCQKDQSQSIGVLGPGNFCLQCLAASYGPAGLDKYESPLPSICID